LAAEQDGLLALQAAAAPVPRVYGLWEMGDAHVLALTFLAFQHRSGEDWGRLGGVLARLHTPAWPQFGWHRDNFLGGTSQRNTPTPGTSGEDWLQFLQQERLQPLLERLWPGLHTAERELFTHLLASLPMILDGHAPRASLTHGDLWSGNWGVDVDGAVWLFDPAVAVTDREMDLAMLELFSTPPAAFWQAYRSLAQPDFDPKGYARRRPLYQLYHLLNHWLLFGRSYAEQALAEARSALSGGG
jgi:fructosamine-3-kinase